MSAVTGFRGRIGPKLTGLVASLAVAWVMCGCVWWSELWDGWPKRYRNTGDEVPNAACQAVDGGILMAGTSSHGTRYDLYYLKTDPDGNMVWTRTWQAPGDTVCYGRGIVAVPDGGFLLAGETCIVDTIIDGAVLLVRCGPDGEPLWSKQYWPAHRNFVNALASADDGGFLVAGTAVASDSHPQSAFAIRTDSTGNVTWTRLWSGITGTEGIATCPDGSSAIVGYGAGRVVVMKVSPAGESLAARQFGEDPAPWGAHAIASTSDGGFVVAGSVGDTDDRGSNAYVLRLDSNLDSLWARSYSMNRDDAAWAVRETPNGGLVLAGWTGHVDMDGGDKMELYVVSAEADGRLRWQRSFGGPAGAFGSSLIVTDDGFAIAVGHISDADGTDFYAVKVKL